jgi:hypothetical protein
MSWHQQSSSGGRPWSPDRRVEERNKERDRREREAAEYKRRRNISLSEYVSTFARLVRDSANFSGLNDLNVVTDKLLLLEDR